MKKYTVIAEYKVLKEMEVECDDESDPMQPSSWNEITSEHDADCWLYDVRSANPSEDC